MNEKQIIAAKGIAGAIGEPVSTIWKIEQVSLDADLRDMNVTTAIERFQEVVQKCRDIERILAEQLPALEKLAQRQE
ncbi:MAG: hypothetical protein E6I91_10455 [Chloroflexi bacterium]|nr:MAG: hypothetical protein E6I91_10455 [Chloroflexota bacterium]